MYQTLGVVNSYSVYLDGHLGRHYGRPFSSCAAPTFCVRFLQDDSAVDTAVRKRRPGVLRVSQRERESFIVIHNASFGAITNWSAN